MGKNKKAQTGEGGRGGSMVPKDKKDSARFFGKKKKKNTEKDNAR